MSESTSTQARRRVVAPPASGPRGGGSGGGQAGAASYGKAPLAAGEGRVGLVLCPRRGTPALDNIVSSGPALAKASDRRRGGIYRGGRWRGAAVKNATTGERRGLRNRRPAVVFLIEKCGLVGPVRCTGMGSRGTTGRPSGCISVNKFIK